MPLMDREQQFIRNRILSQKIAIQLVLRKEKRKKKKKTHTHTKRTKNARKSAQGVLIFEGPHQIRLTRLRFEARSEFANAFNEAVLYRCRQHRGEVENPKVARAR